MDYLRYFAVLAGVLMAVIFVPFVVMGFVRSRKIPECFSCGALKVRPSRVDGSWDSFASAFFFQPHRCGGCRERFLAFAPFLRKAPAPPQPVSPRRVVKMVFRFRHGLPNRIAIRVTAERQTDPVSDRSAVLQA
jgi:hypothetical protein